MSRYGVPFAKGLEVRLDPHPQACELHDLVNVAKTIDRPLAIDLFCGAGGLSYGLHLAGFEVLLAVDKEREAADTHRAHFPGVSLNADLGDQTVLDSICDALKEVQLDLVAGGPPCQPYSQAAFSKVRHLEEHHDKKPDPRRGLWASFLYVVKKTTPRAVLIENVPDLAFGRDGIVMRRLVRDLEALGYFVETRVLSSDAFGVPQHRQRAFVVAFKNLVSFQWPAALPKERRVLRDAISDLPPVNGGEKAERRAYDGPTLESQNYFRKGVKKADQQVIYDHNTRAVRPDDLEIFKLMTSKTKYSEIPKELRRYRSDIFEDKYKRLDWYEVSRTITAHISQDGYWYIHPEQHRTLTIREAARVQTFPDHYRFCGFPRHAFKQIGEAVPPLLGKAIAGAVLKALTSQAETAMPTTTEIANLSVEWFATQDESEMLQPWLKATTLWHRALGLIVFARASAVQIARGYSALCTLWPTPESFILDPSRLDSLATFGREGYGAVIQGLAKLLSTSEPITTEALVKSGLSQGVSLQILAGTECADRKPSTPSLARLAERFWDRPRTDADGRGTQEMLVGRLVGVDESGQAYCALTEIAARYCHARSTQCQFCPLRHLCQTAKTSCPIHVEART